MSNTIEQPVTGSDAPPTATVNNPIAAPGATPTISVDTALQIATLTQERDSANARIKELNRENLKYRLLSESLESLGVTPDVLKTRLETDKSELEAFRAFGTPAEIAATKADLEKDANEAKHLRLEKIAHSVNFKSDVLADLASTKGFRVEQREGKDAEGKTIQVPTAVYQDGDKEAKKPLVEYVEATLPNYLPSLRTEAQAPTGTPHLRQVSGDQKTQGFDAAKASALQAENLQNI